MDLEFKLGLTDEDMRVNLNLTTNKAKGRSHGQMGGGMMAIGIVAHSMAMGLYTTLGAELQSKVSG